MKKHSLIRTLIFSATIFSFSSAFAECVVSRDDVLRMLKDGKTTDEISQSIQGCVAKSEKNGNEVTKVSESDFISQAIKNTGNVDYEAITSCGYHPQRKELSCPLEIRQPTGYGGVPALQPIGSYEYVLFCVDTGSGFVPVNTNGVHVHDEAFGASPNWYTTAVTPVNGAMFSLPLIGQTLNARAILSWAVPPASCNAAPVWGNQATFRIRLDP